MFTQRISVLLEGLLHSCGLCMFHHDHVQMMLLVVVVALCCASCSSLHAMGQVIECLVDSLARLVHVSAHIDIIFHHEGA